MDPSEFHFELPYSLQQWLQQKQSNPNVFFRVRVAESFFREWFPRKTDKSLLSELVCHDYSYVTFVGQLDAGTKLCGYKNLGDDPLSGSYFAPIGTPLDRLGLGWHGRVRGAVVPKVYHRYVVHKTIPAVLASTCAPARDMWSNKALAWGQLGNGGATQYVIPHAREYLELVQRE